MSLIKFASILILTRLLQAWKATVSIFCNTITRYPATVVHFEKNFSRYIGCQYGLTFCNGTSGIEAALFALGIGKGDEVIVPSCTFHSSIDPVINFGATPVFADIDPDTFTISAEDIGNKITERTKAIIIVHLFGTPADMNQIKGKIGTRKIGIIEDTSHAHGAKYNEKMCGSLGDYGVFSLQGDKAVSGGEGGIVTTNNRTGYIRMSLWGHFDRHKDYFPEINAEEFQWTGVGYKRRMAPLSAVLASVDLQFLDAKNRILRQNCEILDNELSRIKDIRISKKYPDSSKGGLYAGYPICIYKGQNSQEDAVNALRKAGINAMPWPYTLHHKLPVYCDRGYRNKVLSQAQNCTYDSSGYPVLKDTEFLNSHGIVLSKRHLATLDNTTINLIKGILEKL